MFLGLIRNRLGSSASNIQCSIPNKICLPLTIIIIMLNMVAMSRTLPDHFFETILKACLRSHLNICLGLHIWIVQGVIGYNGRCFVLVFASKLLREFLFALLAPFSDS